MFPVEELAKQFCEVLGDKMAYSELGIGPPVVFLHGNLAFLLTSGAISGRT